MALATRPKPKTHQRKRQAGHHRQNKPYLKTYWPYIPVAAIIGLGMVVNNMWPSSAAVLGANSNFSINTLLADTNANRSADHEANLTIDGQLTAAAQAKANDMVANNYWAHNSPSGQTPWSFITATGYQYQSAGENLAYGFASAGDAVAGWMNSTEHRANILDADYQNVGFGVAESADFQGHGPQVVIVAEYAQPVAAAANISFNVRNTTQNTPANVKGDQTELNAQPVSRIQVLTGGKAAWATVAASALGGAALALFLVRHGLRLKHWMSEGEAYIAHHPLLDILVTFIFTAGFVLTRVSGVIR
ncbi:MAG TPA: CAP domain-containing protein [Candidatus Saccharimonadales bacterium]|nr:CAP domain-containing protein [Candidatus Saccharimonadales bacterium]